MQTQNTSGSSTKSIIAIVVVVVISAAVYFFMNGNKAPEGEAGLQAKATPEANASAARILVLLKQVQQIKMDTKIFSSPVFQSLDDYSIPIPSVDVGRPNPFAPIPGAPVAPSGTTR